MSRLIIFFRNTQDAGERHLAIIISFFVTLLGLFILQLANQFDGAIIPFTFLFGIFSYDVWAISTKVQLECCLDSDEIEYFKEKYSLMRQSYVFLFPLFLAHTCIVLFTASLIKTFASPDFSMASISGAILGSSAGLVMAIAYIVPIVYTEHIEQRGVTN